MVILFFNPEIIFLMSKIEKYISEIYPIYKNIFRVLQENVHFIAKTYANSINVVQHILW